MGSLGYVIAVKDGHHYKKGDMGRVTKATLYKGTLSGVRAKWYGTHHSTWMKPDRFRYATNFEVAVRKKQWALARRKKR
jgi:hypothetical protein